MSVAVVGLAGDLLSLWIIRSGHCWAAMGCKNKKPKKTEKIKMDHFGFISSLLLNRLIFTLFILHDTFSIIIK
jgi:hypothetical protein